MFKSCSLGKYWRSAHQAMSKPRISVRVEVFAWLSQCWSHYPSSCTCMQHGQTGLMEAARHGRLDVVKLLLECGADKGHQNKVPWLGIWTMDCILRLCFLTTLWMIVFRVINMFLSWKRFISFCSGHAYIACSNSFKNRMDKQRLWRRLITDIQALQSFCSKVGQTQITRQR